MSTSRTLRYGMLALGCASLVFVLSGCTCCSEPGKTASGSIPSAINNNLTKGFSTSEDQMLSGRDRMVYEAERHSDVYPPRFAIAESAGPGGSINPSSSSTVPYGSNRALLINADRGYHVVDVLVDGKSVGAVSRFTFDKVTEDHAISAMFAANPGR